MKIRRVDVRQLPGIDEPFTVHFGEGLNLMVGRNGSGKTSVCRGLRATLWPEHERFRGAHIASEWVRGEARWHATLEDGFVRWQRDGTPVDDVDLPPQEAARCFSISVRDLIRDPHGTDESIAEGVVRALAGGFDLGAVQEKQFQLGARHGRHEQKAVNELRGRVRALKNDEEDLARREATLEELGRRREVAREAQRQRIDLMVAEEAIELRRKLARAERRLQEFSDGMQRLRGGELDTLRREQGLLRDEEARRQRTSEALVLCRRRLEQLDLAEAIENADLEAWKQRARELAQRQSRIDREAGRYAELREAADTLRSHPLVLPAEAVKNVDAEALHALESLLRDAQRIDKERQEIDARSAVLHRVASANSAREVESGISFLRSWLALDSNPPWAPSTAWILAALAGLAAAFLWSLDVRVAAALVGVAATVGGMATFLEVRRRRHRGQVDERREAFLATSLTAPASWDNEAVRARQVALEDDWRNAALAEKERSALAELEERQARLENEEKELQRRRMELYESFGIEPSRLDIEFLTVAHCVAKLFELEAEATGVARELAADREVVLQTLSELNEFLTQHGEPGVSDVSAVMARLDSLQQRCVQFAQRHEESERLTLALAEHDAKAAELEGRIAAIFENVGLEASAEHELVQWSNAFEEYRSAVEEQNACARTLQDVEERLRKRRPDWMSLDEDALLLTRQEVDARVRELESINQQMGSIEDSVERQRHSSELEIELAAVDAAEQRLAAKRSEAMFKAAGSFLLQRVSREYQRKQSPRVLQLAADLFRRFTHNRYELIVDDRRDDRRDGSQRPTFRALETASGHGKALGELSGGTHLQLLLAVRLAFALSSERDGDPMPIVLDEVLTTTDPERFQAVAESLVVLIRDQGRQVIYTSAQPAEIAAWQSAFEDAGLAGPHLIDLDAIRGAEAAVSDVRALAPPREFVVPEPAGLSAEEYADHIAVPVLRPGRGSGAVHLFYLLRGDLEWLHRLLSVRLETVGQLKSALEAGALPSLLPGVEIPRLAALIELVESFCDLWRIGRGRPVRLEALRAAGLTATAVERLRAPLDRCGGDARALLKAIDEKRVKNFRRDQRDKLADYLLQDGHLDVRDILDSDAMRDRVLARLRRVIESGELTPEEVTRRLRELEHCANVGEADTRAGVAGPGAARPPATPGSVSLS